MVREQLDNLCHLGLSRSTGRENEKVLVETEVGAKEEKVADQGSRKGPGRAE